MKKYKFSINGADYAIEIKNVKGDAVMEGDVLIVIGD